MPYRALMWTIMTVGLALLTVGLWVRAVEPIVAGVMAENSGTGAATQGAVVTAGGQKVTTVQELKLVVKGTLLLAFVLIGALLVVGMMGTYREWMRYRSGMGERKRARTKYVDAWKIAGERLKEKESGGESEGESGEKV